MFWKMIIVMACFNSFAQDENTVKIKDTKVIEASIDSIGEMTAETYVNQVDLLRETIEKFLAAKKKVCLGEYAPYLLSSAGEGKLPLKTKLENKEKTQCFDELKKMHANYIENMYVARKRYLESSYKKRLEELARYRDQALQDIKNAYSR